MIYVQPNLSDQAVWRKIGHIHRVEYGYFEKVTKWIVTYSVRSEN